MLFNNQSCIINYIANQSLINKTIYNEHILLKTMLTTNYSVLEMYSRKTINFAAEIIINLLIYITELTYISILNNYLTNINCDTFWLHKILCLLY